LDWQKPNELAVTDADPRDANNTDRVIAWLGIDELYTQVLQRGSWDRA
jgi:hypothetical protein